MEGGEREGERGGGGKYSGRWGEGGEMRGWGRVRDIDGEWGGGGRRGREIQRKGGESGKEHERSDGGRERERELEIQRERCSQVKLLVFVVLVILRPCWYAMNAVTL